jgi:hypothetical protein
MGLIIDKGLVISAISEDQYAPRKEESIGKVTTIGVRSSKVFSPDPSARTPSPFEHLHFDSHSTPSDLIPSNPSPKSFNLGQRFQGFIPRPQTRAHGTAIELPLSVSAGRQTAHKPAVASRMPGLIPTQSSKVMKARLCGLCYSTRNMASSRCPWGRCGVLRMLGCPECRIVAGWGLRERESGVCSLHLFV